MNKRGALRGRAGRMEGGRGSGRASTGAVRLWGRHAVEAALNNPDRTHRKLWATREGVESLDGELPENFPVEYAQGADLARFVARDAPHQCWHGHFRARPPCVRPGRVMPRACSLVCSLIHLRSLPPR